MPEEARIFHFHSDAVNDDTFQVSGLTGIEELSRPYRFEIELMSKKADVPLDKMLNNKAWLSIRQSVPVSGGKRGTRIYKMHGIISDFEVLEQIHESIKYRAILVPRLWKATLTTRSRVFQDVKIKDLIKEVLNEKENPPILQPSDYDVKAESKWEREFVVQYNETDLDFLHRWLEHEGVFYFFDQTESGEKIIFGDTAEHYTTLPGDPKIPYRPDPASRSRAAGATAEETMQEESVHSFRCHVRKTTRNIVMKDYNYRTPSVEIKGKAENTSPGSEGMLYVYGEHFKKPEDGAKIAKLRAEEFQCRDKTFVGTGDHRSFRPGCKFTLSEHYRADFNATYMLTSIRHKLAQGTGSTGGSAMSYENEFECIPAADVFRPERVTPWPSIHGFINAKVDAGSSGQYAEIDSEGRYKVKLPFDLSDKKDGKASRFIRMAQPYSGANMGMHFPLHKDTEVMLSFIDGDPDRPIIASAIPNAESTPPVTSHNQTQSVIRTGSGIRVQFEDDAGNERLAFTTPHSNTFLQIGAPTNGAGGSNGAGGGSSGAPAPGAEPGVNMGTDKDINFQSARDYIHRTGGNVTIETTKNELKITQGDTASETHGNAKTWTKGNTESETVGNSKSKVTGNSESETIGNSKSKTVGSSDETFTGTKTSKSLSAENEMTMGAKNSMSATTEAETAVGAKSEIFSGIKFESTTGLSTEANKGGKITLCDLTEIKTAQQKLEEVTAANEIKGGTITIDATTALTLEGGTSITIKCGGSEITMSPGEIKIKSPSITIEGSGKVDVKSDGMATVKGSMIKVDGQVMEG